MNPAFERLWKLLRSERLPHAQAFLSLSREIADDASTFLAKGLFCLHPQAAGPCLRCTACLKVDENAHPDVLKISPEKQELTIDAVRELHRWVLIRPYEGQRKLGIVRDAQAMNLAASNALLKILEEPPAHGILVLQAPTLEGLLPTVRSRVFPIRFAGAKKSSDEERPADPEWWDEFQSFLNASKRLTEGKVLALSERISKDKDHFSSFFEAFEGAIRKGLVAEGREDPTLHRRLSLLFDQTLISERELLQRYGNANLHVDRLLLGFNSRNVRAAE